MEESDLIRIGSKEIGSYLLAIAVKAGRGMNTVKLQAFGRQTEKAMYLAKLAGSMGYKTTSTSYIKQKFETRDGKEIEVDGVVVLLTK